MFIIFNISGLLVGIAGVFVGLVVFLLSGWLSLGVLALGIVWLGLGVYWRKTGVTSGEKRPYPALFFIPLPFVAVPIALLALPMLLVEWGARSQPADPRAPLLKADEQTLNSTLVGGDQRLSGAVLDGLQVMTVEEAGADAYHVFSRRRGDAVLVLVKVPNLKDYEDSARRQLLDLISKIAEADPSSSDERIYVGVKGRLVYGAIKLSSGKTIIKGVIREDELYAFYEEPLNTSGQAAMEIAEVEPRSFDEVRPMDTEREQAAATPDNEIARSSSIARSRPRRSGRARTGDRDPRTTTGKQKRLGNYAGPASVEATGLRVTPETSLVEGMIVQAHWGSSWYPATVHKVEGDSVLIEWNGWSRRETLPRSRLALAPPEIPQPDGAKLSAPAGVPTSKSRARKAVEASRPDAQTTPGSEGELGAYAGPGSVPPTGRTITADTRLVEGMIVQAHWGSSWFPATVREVDGDSILIEWNGWNQSETLPRSRLAFAPPEIPQPEGAPLKP